MSCYFADISESNKLGKIKMVQEIYFVVALNCLEHCSTSCIRL
jgi:hypothetical protein